MEQIKNLKQGQDIYFVGEKLPMKINAINDNFAVCTRELHRRHDSRLLHFEVERGCYWTFTEAYNHLKDEMVYSCLDFNKKIKASHNIIFNNYDFKSQEDINKLLKDLSSGETMLSKRSEAELLIDWTKTK